MKKYEPMLLEREYSDGESGGFNRDDSDRNSNDEGSSPFAKDKRKRIKRTEKAVPVRRDQGEGRPSEPRRSFNPNFDQDNRPRWNKDQRDNRGYNGGSGGPKKYGNGDDRGQKKYGNNENRGPRKYGNNGEVPNKYGKPGDNRSKYGQKGRSAVKRDNRGMINGEYPKFPAPRYTEAVRLNRFIASAGICSRREADENIKLGLISVNGEVITELGTKVMPDDIVRFNGSIVRSEKKIYVLMNKPKGYVTTLEDPHAAKTVMDLIKNVCEERIYPVGRLDKNSLGVLLLTNDGDLTKRLTHPTHNKKKIYQVTLDKQLSEDDRRQIAEGIELEDGPIKADSIDYVHDNPKEIGIEIHSGRNRIVRRIFEQLGYKVQKLDRVYFAGLTKKNLKRGAWRFLSPREVEILKSGMYE